VAIAEARKGVPGQIGELMSRVAATGIAADPAG
jgi:hypothetical protein